MKKELRIAAVIITVLTLAVCMGLTCFGAGENHQQSNAEIGRQKCQLLDELCNERYLKKLEKDEHSAEMNTCMAIQRYVTEIKALMYGDRAQTEDLSAEIELLYKKGVAAGILSWIYYSHNETAHIEEVKSIYNSKLADIDRATSVNFFDNGTVEGCYTELFQRIYSEKLLGLAREGDSDTVKAIINAAPISMGSVCRYDEQNSDGEDGGNYKAFYLGVVRSVTEQRNRDRTARELLTVFEILYPKESADTSPRLVEFNNTLSTKKDIAEMNSLLSETVGRLLGGLATAEGQYRNAYLDKKANDVAAAALAAGSSEIASVSESFADFSIRLAAADAKDSLAAYAEALAEDGAYGELERDALLSIVGEFTAVGEGFDKCESRSEVEELLFISKLRCFWYDTHLSAKKAIRKYLGEGSAIESDADGYYSDTVARIDGGEIGFEEAPEEALAPHMTAMDAFVIEAEAESFRQTHRDILLKPEADIGDKAALSLAIADGEALSEPARELLWDILLSLGKKYKNAVCKEIAAHVKADGAQSERIILAERLVASVTELPLVDSEGALALTALKDRADVIARRAEMIKELFDTYNGEYLSGVTKYFAADAKEAALDFAERIRTAEDGETSAEAEKGRLELLRFAALEKIYDAAEGYFEVEPIKELLENALEEVGELSDKDGIEGYAQGKISEISELIRKEEIARAERELAGYAEEIEKSIQSYEYIGGSKKEELLSELGGILSEETEKIKGSTTKAQVLEGLAAARDRLAVFAENARLAESSACLTEIKEKLNASFGKKEDYSSENYVKILEIIKDCEEALAGASSVSEYVSIGEGGIIAVMEIEDLLEEAVRLSKEKLLSEYERLMVKKYCYSADSLQRLSEIYQHSLSELDGFSAVSDAPLATRLADERIALMRGVNFQKIYTGDGILAAEGEQKYPEGHDLLSGGYIGAVSSQSGIPSDTLLNITVAEDDGIAELIKKAAKRGRIFTGGDRAEREMIKLLKHCGVLAAVNIDTGGALADGGSYRVSLLVPDGMDMSELIGAVFIGEDGRVEFYPVTQGASVVEFDTTHFSSYYLVGRGAADLTPWIICLCVIILCEIAIVALLLARKRKREAGAQPLAAFMLPTALAVSYRPELSQTVLALLGGVAVALGGLIAYLLYGELREARKRKRALAEGREVSTVMEIPEAVPEAISEPVPEPVPEAIPEAAPVLAQTAVGIAEKEDTNEDVGEDKADNTVLPSVSAEEAEALMSDCDAVELGADEYEDREIYRGVKKAEINIDVISDAFEDGDVVTLNSLKEKKLLPKSVGHVKILARGVLDKRLTVVAQDFSRSAIKMILLTGGRAVLTYQSEDRGGRK